MKRHGAFKSWMPSRSESVDSLRAREKSRALSLTSRCSALVNRHLREADRALRYSEMLSDDDVEDENDDEMDRDLMPSDDDDSADDDGHPLPSVSALSPAEIEARKAALVAPFDVSDWGRKSQLSAQSASTQAPAEEKEARPSSSSSATTPASQSASASALPISSETRKLEELDRRQRIKDLKDEEAKNLPPIKMRRPLLPRDQFDGVDSDDDSDGEGNGAADHGEDARSIKAAMKREGMDIDDGKGKDDGENDEDDDDKDQSHVVRDFEVDMAQEEEDFLKFAREALGVDEGMWESILSERAGRGCEWSPLSSFLHQFYALMPSALLKRSYLLHRRGRIKRLFHCFPHRALSPPLFLRNRQLTKSRPRSRSNSGSRRLRRALRCPFPRTPSSLALARRASGPVSCRRARQTRRSIRSRPLCARWTPNLKRGRQLIPRRTNLRPLLLLALL